PPPLGPGERLPCPRGRGGWGAPRRGGRRRPWPGRAVPPRAPERTRSLRARAGHPASARRRPGRGASAMSDEQRGLPAMWWREDGNAAAVWSHIRSLETRQRTRVWRDYVNERIYGSSIGADGPRATGEIDQLRAGFMPADLNFTRTIVDALVARVANDRPAIRYAADDAQWGQRRKAKQLE